MNAEEEFDGRAHTERLSRIQACLSFASQAYGLLLLLPRVIRLLDRGQAVQNLSRDATQSFPVTEANLNRIQPAFV